MGEWHKHGVGSCHRCRLSSELILCQNCAMELEAGLEWPWMSPKKRDPEVKESIIFFVPGIPVPKGSKSAYPWRTKDGARSGVAITETNIKKQRPWRLDVAYCAMEARQRAGLKGWMDREAIALSLQFVFVPPKTKRKDRMYPVVKPDLDKLERTILDALTGVIYRDDAQVVDVLKSKRYTRPEDDRPGVLVVAQEKIAI